MSWRRPSTIRVALSLGILLTVLLTPALTLVNRSAPSSMRATMESPSRVVDHGPASMVTATTTAEQIGDRIYTATSGVSPIVVGAYDPATKRVEETYELPTGDGAWGMTHIGTDLYVGVYGPGDLYRIDTETGEVDKVARFGQWIWDLTVSPDGKVFGGTYPKAEVFEFDPATGKSRNLGVAAPGESYVRSIAVSESTIYAGIGSHAGLVVIDRATGARRDVLPERYRDHTFVGTLDLHGDTLAAALSPTATLLLFDTDDLDPSDEVQPREVRPPTDDTYIPSLAIDRSGAGTSGDVVFGTRPSGTLYRYVGATGELTELGSPYPGATFYSIFPGTETIRAELPGEVLEYNIDSGKFGLVGLAEAGLPPRPELPMAIAATEEHVLVSGKAGIQVHDVRRQRASERIRLGGEAKTMTPVPGRGAEQVYLGVYTLARIFASRPDGSRLSELDRIGAEQTRPTDSTYAPDANALLVATEPDYGRMEGALGILELPDAPDGQPGELDVHRGVLPNQSVFAVAARGQTAILGGSIRNGLGTRPVESEARLAAFDLRDRTVSWQLRPVPGARVVSDLVAHRGRVFGTTDNGKLFELDPISREVRSVLEVGKGMGALVEANGRLYGADGDHVYQVDTSDSGAPVVRTLVDGLGSKWYGGRPLLAATPHGESVYALRKRNLIEIRTS